MDTPRTIGWLVIPFGILLGLPSFATAEVKKPVTPTKVMAPKTMNTHRVLIETFITDLNQGFARAYGARHPEYARELASVARAVAELVSIRGDALYHNLEHLIDVTIVGQEILQGLMSREEIPPAEWVGFLVACICHDVGYVKGLFSDDLGVTNSMSGASLTRVHVDRSKRYAVERFSGHPFVNGPRVAELIEYTRVPNRGPDDPKDRLGPLIRGADYIGQLGNVHYRNRQVGLFFEFEESGFNQQFGYKTVEDMRDKYPAFFNNVVAPFVKPAIALLDLTETGSQMVTNLYGNVKRAEIEAIQAAPPAQSKK